MAASAETPLAGRYRVLRRLGSGGVATVFLAEDERLGRNVAVKRLHADRAEEMAERFEREARLGASLNHPNLVAVYDITADAEAVLIVMEYVGGRTLADAIRQGTLDPERTVAILRGVAGGLDHAHAQGVVHRDVKPANVLLGDDGRIKLADLGIAIAAEATQITVSGTVLGTPSYMAPEQLEGADAGPAVDIYALATMGFEALTGRKARQGGTPLEVAHRVANEPAPDVREAWPEAPPALAEALCAGMAADPADRPQSANELVERLSAAVADMGASPTIAPTPNQGPPASTEEDAPPTPPQRPPPPSPRPPDRPPARPSRARWLALAAVALLALGVLAAVLASGGEDAPQDAPAEQAEDAPSAEGAAPSPAEEDAAAAPEDTVTSFYETAAAGDYDAAWALATPGFRSQLGGFQAFQQQQSTLESIEFEQAETTEESGGSAEVEISTVATHSDGVDQCEGTLSLVSDGEAGWLIGGADITCPESTRPG
jgi:serine/threonine-protein kinase